MSLKETSQELQAITQAEKNIGIYAERLLRWEIEKEIHNMLQKIIDNLFLKGHFFHIV